MHHEIDRREAFRPIALLSLVVIAPSLLLGCSKKPNCNDTTGLAPGDLRTRNETVKYVDESPDAAKRCSGCTLYLTAQPNQCGGCSVVKGPINPDGYCTLFVAKPT